MPTVFFYGLFMDEALLVDKGFQPSASELGFVEGYELNIGERATLVKSSKRRAYGVTMVMSKEELDRLYSESSVCDYHPEYVSVTTFDDQTIKAIVYNLPLEKLVGQNKHYAQLLAKTASEAGMPIEYILEIQRFAVEPS